MRENFWLDSEFTEGKKLDNFEETSWVGVAKAPRVPGFPGNSNTRLVSIHSQDNWMWECHWDFAVASTGAVDSPADEEAVHKRVTNSEEGNGNIGPANTSGDTNANQRTRKEQERLWEHRRTQR